MREEQSRRIEPSMSSRRKDMPNSFANSGCPRGIACLSFVPFFPAAEPFVLTFS
jgi:hypothetical protein